MGRGAEVAPSQTRTAAKMESCGGEASRQATRPVEPTEAAARLAAGSRLQFFLDDAQTVVTACLHCQAVLVAGDRCAVHDAQSMAPQPKNVLSVIKFTCNVLDQCSMNFYLGNNSHPYCN